MASILYNGSAGVTVEAPVEDEDPPQFTPDGWYLPKLNFVAADLASPGVRKFFGAVPDVSALLADAVTGVCKRLYGAPGKQPRTQTRITLHVRPMPGVAYTTGSAAHKEIHLSSTYVDGIAPARLAASAKAGKSTWAVRSARPGFSSGCSRP